MGAAVKSEKGTTFIETVVALALFGIIAVVFLGTLGTATKASMVADEQATAECLVRGEVAYLNSYTYQYSVSEYPVDPSLSIPSGWSMPNPTVESLRNPDDGIQKVTIGVLRNGDTKLSVNIYKSDR